MTDPDHRQPLSTRRRLLAVAAVAAFGISTVLALRALPGDRGDLDLVLLALAAALVIPGAIVNAEEHRVSARILGQAVPFGEAMRVTVIAASVNLLPLPGSVLVRARALTLGGATTRHAFSSTAAVGAAYVGAALLVVGGAQATNAPGPAAALATVGIGATVAAVLLIHRLAGAGTGRLVRELIAVEVASVGVKAARIHVVIAALGFEPSLARSVSMSMATVAASAIGVFPGGLGVREVLGGLIASAVGLPAAAGVVATSLERVIVLAVLALVALAVLWSSRRTAPHGLRTRHSGGQPSPVADIDAVFKAYDIRGTTPDQLDADLVRRIGVAFARFVRTQPYPHERVYVARDMRPTGVELVAAFCDGVTSQGMDVTVLGLASTDLLYFAAGHFDAPGAMFTASHNPAEYNGIKMTLAGARPIGVDSGLGELKRIILEDDLGPQGTAGTVAEDELLDAFADHVRSFVDVAALVPMKVVADTANGMGGLVVPKVFEKLPFELEVMYGELDGTFPNHPADPLNMENLRDLQARVVETGADVGLAFDGDADRVFLVDDLGEPLPGSTTTAIVAKGVLAKDPGATILHNLICSKAVAEVVRENGGTPVRTRVGHSFIKADMAETGAAFGGEHSAHYYFRDNWRADSGAIAALVVLEQLSLSGQKLSELRKPFERYAASGEINTRVDDPLAVIETVAATYAEFPQDRLDGLTVDCGDWWFNLRPSNTEPLLRLNLEASSPEQCAEKVAEVKSRF